MLILIMGKNGSGKSVWAEKLAVKCARGRLIYIATMIPYGDEGLARVARHCAMRRQSGFITMEIPWRLDSAALQSHDTVLLEDVANLTANMLFAASPMDAPAVLDNIKTLAGRCQALLAVSIGGIEPTGDYDAPTLHYIEVLRQVNEGLLAMADTVFEMADGRPLLRKGRG
ncbi:MAG: bifunctional adenosylcobinamide kinase/adenosylcobinamide-phosphate guanylyltransferase [Clostridiales bacterium]|nr:bifunctional adenosylcobinamide kinase/adenosylcobinamide-phosphate guanylyltransferase [Clostridiales bacterium]